MSDDRAAGRVVPGRAWVLAPWLVATACALWVVAERPWAPWADQLALIACSPLTAGYPAISAGLSSCWLSGFATAFASADPVAQNLALRMLAAALYLASAGVLAASVIDRAWLHLALAALALATLHPFVWLSSELFVAAALCTSLAACLRGWPAWALGALLGVLAFTKPEMVLVSALLMAWAVRQPDYSDARRRLLGAFVLVALVLVLPGIWQHGLGYPARGNRSFHSFAQHAQILFTGRWRWGDWQAAAQAYFPGAHSVVEAVWLHPTRYAQYLGLSAQRLWPGLRDALGPVVLAVPVAGAWAVTHPAPASRFTRLMALSLVGVLPWLLLSLPHVRYFARYVPVLLCGFGLSVLAIRRAPPGSARTLALALYAGLLGYAVYAGARTIADALAQPPAAIFWGAD